MKSVRTALLAFLSCAGTFHTPSASALGESVNHAFALIAYEYFATYPFYALPVFGAGDLESGDVVNALTSETLLDRRTCYPGLAAPARRNRRDDFPGMLISKRAGAGLKLRGTVYRALALGGSADFEFLDSSTFAVEEGTVEEPKPEQSLLRSPASTAICDTVRRILDGQQEYANVDALDAIPVIVGSVFNGRRSLALDLKISGAGELQADLEKRLKKLVPMEGAIEVSGGYIVSYRAKGRDIVPLAFRPFAVNVAELLTLRAQYDQAARDTLREFFAENDVTVPETPSLLREILRRLKLLISPKELWARLVGGQVEEFTPEKDKAQGAAWSDFAEVYAANEIASAQ